MNFYVLCIAVLYVLHVLRFAVDEKINSMRRLRVLRQDLIRELVPEVGLRADFEDCLFNLRKSVTLGEVYYIIVSYISLLKHIGNYLYSKQHFAWCPHIFDLHVVNLNSFLRLG